VQIADERSQTDVFAGYQSKFFGWRNLYAGPFNSNETENIKTTLYAVNHEVKLDADGDYVTFGAYHRRNVDDYEFNRVPPADVFLHETRVNGAAMEGRDSLTDATALRYRAGVVADEIDSRALTFGPFESRTQYYAGLFAEHRINLSLDNELSLLGGANYDDSNRDPSAVSPVVEVALERENSPLRRVYASYSGSTQLPTYTALSSNPAGGLFGGNPDLGRAKSRNLEVGADVAAGGWALRGAVFYRQDRDLLDWVFGGAVPPPPVRRAVEGDIDTFGVELTARRDWDRLSVIFGYTLLDKDEDYLAPGESSFYADNYAEHRMTAAFVADLGAGFGLRMDNELRHQADNALRRRGEDKIISSLGLDYEVPGVRGLTLSAQVDNLWNTYFEEVPLVPGVRREWSVSATYAW
jgi:outer membrane cobalamin receptor